MNAVPGIPSQSSTRPVTVSTADRIRNDVITPHTTTVEMTYPRSSERGGGPFIFSTGSPGMVALPKMETKSCLDIQPGRPSFYLDEPMTAASKSSNDYSRCGRL